MLCEYVCFNIPIGFNIFSIWIVGKNMFIQMFFE
jgi:hypothetical protein